MCTSEQTDNYPKEWRRAGCAGLLKRHSLLPECSFKLSSRRAGCWMPSTDVSDSLQWGCFKQNKINFAAPTRSNFTTCTHTGNYLPWLGESSAACSVLGQDIQVKERSPKAHPCFQTHGRAPHKAPWPSYTLQEHKMVPTHSAFCPSQAAQQDVTAQERTVDVTAQEITSCYRNIQRDTAGQLVMSAALNHKHFELFWYNGKLWEGEGTSTGQK